MNKQPVISTPGEDLDLSKVAASFPNATSAFEVEYWDDFSSYEEFYDKVYEIRNAKPLYPYRYGSYQVYMANTKNNTY